jgi:8-oxo-dGTP diphosphatase
MTRLSDANEALGIAHKRSVALVIRHRARASDLLLVQRPPDDGDFPRLWGLPAASLRDQESWHEAARRVGTGKLGVDLRIGTELARGSQMRREGSIEMRLYEAVVQVGQHPAVPGEDDTVTQYTTWRWGEAEHVRQSAIRGSLCSQLLLQFTAHQEQVAQAAADRAAQHATRSAEESAPPASQGGDADDAENAPPSSDDREAPSS